MAHLTTAMLRVAKPPKKNVKQDYSHLICFPPLTTVSVLYHLWSCISWCQCKFTHFLLSLVCLSCYFLFSVLVSHRISLCLCHRSSLSSHQNESRDYQMGTPHTESFSLIYRVASFICSCTSLWSICFRTVFKQKNIKKQMQWILQTIRK